MKPISRFVASILPAVLAVLLGACASMMVSVAPSQRASKPAPDKALVYFVRPPSTQLTAVLVNKPVPLFADDKFLGFIDEGTHLAVQLEPGKHVFMAFDRYPDFVVAELATARSYYIKVQLTGVGSLPVFETYTGQYSIDQFLDWIDSTIEVTASADGRRWGESNVAQAARLRQRDLPGFETRLGRVQAELDKHSLGPEHGRPSR